MMKFIGLLFLFVSVTANAQIFSETQSGPNVNLLKNPGFESGFRNGWSIVAGTASADTALELEGTQALSISTSAVNGTVVEQAANSTLCGRLAGQNLEASIYVRTTSSTYQVCSTLDGVEVQCQNVSSANTWSKYVLNFVGVASQSCGVRIKTSSATTGTVKIDKAYVGLATNIGTVSQASLVAAGYIAGSSGCAWSRTNTAIGAFGTDADCVGVTVESNAGPGTLVTTDTDLPQFTVNNLPPGDYEVEISGGILTGDTGTAATMQTAMYDGTTYSHGNYNITDNTATRSGLSVYVKGVYSYSSTGNRTFAIHGSASANAIFVSNNSTSAANTRLNFRIKRFPTASEQAIRPTDAAWYVDANIAGANPSLGSSSVSSYTEITNGSLTMTPASGSAPVGVMCSGTNAATAPTTAASTCSVGNESIGFNVNIPKAGVYEVCGYFTHYAEADAAEAVSAVFQWIETPTNAQTNTQLGRTRTYSGIANATGTFTGSVGIFPYSSCSLFTFSSSGTKGMRLMYEQSIAGTPNNSLIVADADANQGGRDMRITMKPFLAATPAPLLTGSVTYNDTVRADGAAGLNTVASGTYTPTITNGVNMAANNPRSCRYLRVANVVSVSCFPELDCTTATATDTEINISLPVASALTGTTPISGSFSSPLVDEPGRVVTGTSNAKVEWKCSNGGNVGRAIDFMYIVN